MAIAECRSDCAVYFERTIEYCTQRCCRRMVRFPNPIRIRSSGNAQAALGFLLLVGIVVWILRSQLNGNSRHAGRVVSVAFTRLPRIHRLCEFSEHSSLSWLSGITAVVRARFPKGAWCDCSETMRSMEGQWAFFRDRRPESGNYR